jgi:hypothetical protein
VPTQDVQRHLAREAEIHHETAQRHRGDADAKDRGEFGDGPQTMSLRVAIRLPDALADGAEWARTVPPAGRAR